MADEFAGGMRHHQKQNVGHTPAADIETEVAIKPIDGADQPLLTESQVTFFREQGYLRLETITSTEEIQEIRQSLANLFANKAGEKEGAFADLVAGADHADDLSSPQILNPVNYAPKLHNTQCFRNALHIAKQLLGKDARCFFDLSILKMPRCGAGPLGIKTKRSGTQGLNTKS